MNTNDKYNTAYKALNLIGEISHKQFLRVQAAYGIAQRGGINIPSLSEDHAKRLVSDINLLNTVETRRLIFSETIISN